MDVELTEELTEVMIEDVEAALDDLRAACERERVATWIDDSIKEWDRKASHDACYDRAMAAQVLQVKLQVWATQRSLDRNLEVLEIYRSVMREQTAILREMREIFSRLVDGSPI